MAMVVEKDGSTSSGGIVAVRQAFIDAAGGKLICSDARMGYDHSGAPNAQVLEFAGHFASDSAPFSIKSKPILPGAALAPVAAKLAQQVLNGRG